MKIELTCMIDGDGHFRISPVSDREKVFKDLKSICDGDHFINTVDEFDYDFEKEYKNLSNEDWLKALNKFVQRGMFEFSTLEL